METAREFRTLLNWIHWFSKQDLGSCEDDMTCMEKGICCQANCRVPASLDAGRPPSRQAWIFGIFAKFATCCRSISTSGNTFLDMIPELFAYFWGRQLLKWSPKWVWHVLTSWKSCNCPRVLLELQKKMQQMFINKSEKGCSCWWFNAHYTYFIILTNIHHTKLVTLSHAFSHHCTYPPSSCSISHNIIMFWPYLIDLYFIFILYIHAVSYPLT